MLPWRIPKKPRPDTPPVAIKKKRTHRGGRSGASRAALKLNDRGDGFYQSQLRLNSDKNRLAAQQRDLVLDRKLLQDKKEVLQAAQQQARHQTCVADRRMHDADRKTHWAWTAVHGDLTKEIHKSALQKTNLAVHQLVMIKGASPMTAVEMVALEKRKEQASFEALLVQREAAAAQSVAARAAASAQSVAAHAQGVAARAEAQSFFDDTMKPRTYPPGWSTPLPTGYFDRPLRNPTERAAYATLQGRFIVRRAAAVYWPARA